jgi:hypothetical protein
MPKPHYRTPEPLPESQRSEFTKADVRLRWAKSWVNWGPVCPLDESHGALIDVQGTSRWFCRHQDHDGSGVRPAWTEDDLLTFEWDRLQAERNPSDR